MMNVSQQLQSKVDQAVELDEQIKKLTKERDNVKDEVKAELLANNETEILATNGSKISLTEVVSYKVGTEQDKYAFALFLRDEGLKHCIDVKYEPNMEEIKHALTNGTLSQIDYDKYVKEISSYRVNFKK